MAVFDSAFWITLHSGRGFEAVGSTRDEYHRHVQFRVVDRLSQQYLRRWFTSGEVPILSLDMNRSTYFSDQYDESIEVTFDERAVHKVEPLKAITHARMNDPIAHDFLVRQSLSDTDLRDHVECGTVELVQTPAGGRYDWAHGMAKAEAEAALRVWRVHAQPEMSVEPGASWTATGRAQSSSPNMQNIKRARRSR